MKSLNYLLFLLLFPIIQYAVLENDLVQLVVVLENVNPLLPVPTITETTPEDLEAMRAKEQDDIMDNLNSLSRKIEVLIDDFLKQEQKTYEMYSEIAYAMRNFKEAIEKEIKQENTREKPLFAENDLEKYKSYYFGKRISTINFLALYILEQYPRINLERAIKNPKNIDKMLQDNIDFFKILQPLPEDKAKILEAILDKYLNLLEAGMEYEEFGKFLKEIKPQQTLSDFLEFINENKEFKTLINTMNYDRARNLLITLNQRYPKTALPILKPREKD